MRSIAVGLFFFFGAAPLASAAPTADELQKMLEVIDERSSVTTGDYKALGYLEIKRKNQEDTFRELVVYRRDAEDQFMTLALRTKAVAGQGSLRLDRSEFSYNPRVGQWSRRTLRERISGTDARAEDLDKNRYSTRFTPTYLGEDKLGRYTTHHLELLAREGVEVAYPRLELWIDQESGNLLKQQEFALSGKLIRTVYLTKWTKITTLAGDDLHYARERRIFDELERGNSTTQVIRKVDLTDLPANMFTKAWLESQSR